VIGYAHELLFESKLLISMLKKSNYFLILIWSVILLMKLFV